MPDMQGWIQVDMSALAASSGLGIRGTRALLRAKWLAGELDLQVIREGGQSVRYYVRPPAPRVRYTASPVRDNTMPTAEELEAQFPDVDALASGSFRQVADRIWYVHALRRARALRLQVPMGEVGHDDTSAA